MKAFLKNPWLLRALEVLLGGIFIYASWHKIADPPDFAKMIYNYKMTPGELINLLAIYLPFVEVVCGVALIAGAVMGSLGIGRAHGTSFPLRRGATALVAGMLVLFIGALAFNLYRGHPVACGCFQGGAAVVRSREELIQEMWVRLFEDAGMLILAVWLLIAKSSAGRAAPRVELSTAALAR